MAEEKSQRTEQPTPRRKEKAREEGQVASSRELTAALQFAVAVGLLSYNGRDAVEGLIRAYRGLLRGAFEMPLNEGNLLAMWHEAVSGLNFYWSMLGVLVGVGVLVHVLQTGFLLNVKKLTPDLKRLNPAQKLREMPGENLMQTLKALAMLPLVGFAFWYVLDSRLAAFMALSQTTVAAGAAMICDAMLELLQQASLVLVALGVIDFARQRRKIGSKLKMTKQEIKQEYKDSEGDPYIKSRLRRMQREMMRKRMMSEVPKATVVITNPTHFAVALKYEPATMTAPLVVAKGVDHLALRIRKVAEEHEIPTVENRPLARALYKMADVGDEIPADLFRAVAEVLAYIYRLRDERPF